MDQSREAMGRNRRGPATRSMMVPSTIGLVLLVGGGLAAYQYFTAPQRVYGAKALDCAVTEISWEESPMGTYLVRGCGKTRHVRCDDTACTEPPEIDLNIEDVH